MSDVYVAFVRDDQSYAEALAVALQGSGFTVSRSPSVVEAIDECGAIVVLWTAAAARSKLFIDAADRAFRSGKMVLARMGQDPLPQMFAGAETHSLSRWSGDPESPEIDAIVFHVDRLVNRGRPRGGGDAEMGQPRERGVVHRFPGGAGAMRATRPVEAPRPAPYQAPVDPLAEEAAYWRRIQHSTDPAEFFAYLDRYGRNGAFAELAEQRMRTLAPRPAPRPGPPANPIPGPMPMPMQHAPQPQVQRGGFSMNPPGPRPAPVRADTYAPRRPEPEPSPPSKGSGGIRGVAFLIFLAIVGGGGFYVYKQLQGPDRPVTQADTAENWTPPAGSPAEPDVPTSESATAAKAATPSTGSRPAPPRVSAPAERRTTVAAARPAPEEGPPPAPIFRTLTPEPAPVTARPVGPDSAGDLQRDVGPASYTPPPPPAAAAVAAPRPPVHPRWAQRPSARDLQNAYPAGAQRRNLEGHVTLDCLIGSDLAIRCRALNETPAGFGFASAALRVAQSFRAAPTLEDGRPAAGERAQVTLVFKPG